MKQQQQKQLENLEATLFSGFSPLTFPGYPPKLNQQGTRVLASNVGTKVDEEFFHFFSILSILKLSSFQDLLDILDIPGLPDLQSKDSDFFNFLSSFFSFQNLISPL